MPNADIPHFTRDPSLAADIADQFGGGAARAENLIAAAQLRQSPELTAANLLPEDIEARGNFSDDDVQEAAELEDGQLIPNSATVRGRYVTYLFESPDGRVGKDALLINDKGDLEAPDRPDSPERAALRASVRANATITDAKQDAAKIIADAQEKAAKIVADAAAEAEEKRAEDAVKAAEEAEKSDGEDAQAKANKKQATPPARTADTTNKK